MVEIWNLIYEILFIKIPIPISFTNIQYVSFLSILVASLVLSFAIFIVKRLLETDGGNNS